MKLYEVPVNTMVKIIDNGETLFFLHHIEGAYCLCGTENGTIIHIPENANVSIIEHIENS